MLYDGPEAICMFLLGSGIWSGPWDLLFLALARIYLSSLIVIRCMLTAVGVLMGVVAHL